MALENRNICCSFCFKPAEEARKMISGPKGVYICDECILVCLELLEDEGILDTIEDENDDDMDFDFGMNGFNDSLLDDYWKELCANQNIDEKGNHENVVNHENRSDKELPEEKDFEFACITMDSGYQSIGYDHSIIKEGTNLSLFNPYIFITEKTITDLQDILPLIKRVESSHGSLLFLAPDISENVRIFLNSNIKNDSVKYIFIRLLNDESGGKDIAEDIAVLTGGQIIFDLKKVSMNQLGQAQSVDLYPEYSVIFGGENNKSLISKRINQIKKDINNVLSRSDREKLEDRLNRWMLI